MFEISSPQKQESEVSGGLGEELAHVISENEYSKGYWNNANNEMGRVKARALADKILSLIQAHGWKKLEE